MNPGCPRGSASSRWCSLRSTYSAASWLRSACSLCTRKKRRSEAMNVNIAALLYLVSGVLFILALRGLASPETARTGNRRGMIGMGLAILTTLAVTKVSDALTWSLVLGGLGIGGAIGAITARRIAMTAM